MIEKVRAIVLGRVRHSDKINIVSLFTDRFGKIAISVSASASRSSALRNSRLMPLAVVEGEISFRPGRDLQTLRSLAPAAVHHDIYSNPVKIAVGMFISEFLGRVLRESPADAPLWHFLVRSLDFFDACRRPENFHLAFLVHIAPLLGVMPDVSGYRADRCFDLRAGSYSDFLPTHSDCLTGAEARLPYALSRISFAAAERMCLSGDRRFELLTGMLRYYSLHIPGLEGMRSLAVLHDTFS